MDEYCMKHGSPHHTKQYYSNRDGLHGTKTVDILTQWGLVLSEEEKAAIRWHMGIHTKDAFAIYNYDYQTASSQSVLVKLIHDADSKSAKLDKE
jgi:VCBS repeat-containing protein